MSIVLDVIIIAIAALFVYSGYKRGLLSSVINFAGSAVSTLLASLIAPMLAVNLYDSFVGVKLEGLIEKKLPEMYMGIKPEEISDKLMKDLPDFVLNAFGLSGIDKAKLTSEISKGMDNIPYLVGNLLKPLAMRLLTIILTLALFLIFTAIVSIITRALTKASDFIGLSTTNKILGAVLGILAAAVIVMVTALLMNVLVVFLPSDSAEYLKQAIDKSIMFRYIYYDLNVPGQLINVMINGGI